MWVCIKHRRQQGWGFLTTKKCCLIPKNHQGWEKSIIITTTKDQKKKKKLGTSCWGKNKDINFRARPNWLMNYDTDMHNRISCHCSVTAAKEWDKIHRTLSGNGLVPSRLRLLEWNSLSCNFTHIIHHDNGMRVQHPEFTYGFFKSMGTCSIRSWKT